MNTKTNKIWLTGLAVLALTCALANTALGQATSIVWDAPAALTYGTALDDFQNILNARALDSQNNDVTSSGKLNYFWTPPAPPVAVENFAGFPAGGFSSSVSSDRDGNTDGVQKHDWLFPDVGDLVVTVTFSHTQAGVVNPAPITRTIKINPAVVSAVPSTLTRDFGEENFLGYETDLLPRYPSGNLMFRLHRNGNDLVNNPNDNTVIDAKGNVPNTDTAVADIQFDLSNGNRVLVRDDGDNTVINDRSNNPMEVPLIGSNQATHYSQTGGPVTFSGFVRGETYANLVALDDAVASQAEQQTGINPNDASSLVKRKLALSVRDGDGNDIFRGASVSTVGTVSFSQVPGFKNYTVATGANGTLTVERAEIKYRAKTFTDDNGGGGIIIDVSPHDGVNDQALAGNDGDGDGKWMRKTYGNGIDVKVGGVINTDILKEQDFPLSNNFRLGEAFIETLLDATAPGLAENAPVGTTAIDLFLDPQTLLNNTAFLDNYAITLEGGSLTTIAREIDLIALDATKGYGRLNPAFGFNVHNPAPHDLGSNVNLAQNNIYASGDLVDDFFSAAPTLSTSASIGSNVGTYSINIAGGAASNYTIDDRNAGTLTITRANLVIQVQNTSMVQGGTFNQPSLQALGLLPFDSFPALLTNQPQFLYYQEGNPFGNVPEGTLRSTIGTYRIEISNKAAVRATNYNVFFNDGTGAYDGINDAAGGGGFVDDGFGNPTDDMIASNGGGFAFTGFTGNAPTTPIPQGTLGYDGNNQLFNTDAATKIGRYSVGNVGVTIQWNQPSAVPFGDLLGGRLNASFINPFSGLDVGDGANSTPLTQGVHYNVTYEAADGGALIKANANAEQYVRFNAGEPAQVRVVFQLTNQAPPNLGFGNAALVRNILVTGRTIKVDANDKTITFGQNIPNQNEFGHTYEDLPGGHYATGVKPDGAPIDANNPGAANFIAVEVDESDIAYSTTASAGSDAGTYPLTPSGLKAKDGNVAFNYINGDFKIDKAGTTLSYSGDLAAITYGTPLGDAQFFATGPAGVPGSVTYNRSVGQILSAGVHAIEAQFIPDSSNFANSAKVSKNIRVNLKPLSAGAVNVSKFFGDDNPAFTPTPESLVGLIPQDVGLITLTFQTVANEKSNVGDYPVEPVLSDSNNKLNNYDLTIQSANLKINKRPVTVTPADRSMQVETNPVPFLNDFMTTSPGNDTRPSSRLTFNNLASFHVIDNDKFGDTGANGKGFHRIRNLFTSLSLATTGTIGSDVGQSFPINVGTLTPSATLVNGAKADGNYEFTKASGTLSITSKKPTITWADIALTYGQAISASGVERAKAGDDSQTQAVDLFDATATPTGGTFEYTIKDQGPLVDGIVFPAGEHKVVVTYTPPASASDFGPESKEMTLTINKRPLNITILDQTNTYGGVDQNFQARYGEIRKTGESTDDYNTRQSKSPNRLVNNDTPESLDQQLVLFSNATPASGAGTYYIAVAQTAEDSNYDIRPVFGSQILRNGITRDQNGAVLANIGTNISGVGATTSFVTQTGDQHSFLPGTGTPSTPVNFSEVVAAGVRTTTINDGTPADNGPIEFHAGKLTINKAPLTITADDQSKDQGQPNPDFTATANPEQLRNGDTLENLLRTQLIFISSVQTDSPVGTFPISVTGGSSDNYIITHQAGTFNVQPPAAPIGWNPNPSAIMYGAGLTGDQLNASSTVSGTFDYSANPLGAILPAGTQTLTVVFTPDDLLANRQTTATATLQVDPAPLGIAANNISRGFLEDNPPFTVAFDGFVNGDGPGVLTSPVTFATDGVNGAAAGSYPLIPGGATADNYSVNFVPGTITVAKAAAQVSLSGLDQVADGNAKQATVVTDPTGISVNVTYNGSSVLPSDPGTYEVRAIVNDANYQGFAIATLSLSGTGAITITDLVQTFDGNPKPATVATSPVGLTTLVTYNGNSMAPVNAGTYEVRVIVDDPVFSGFAIDVLEVQPAQAQVNFDLASLVQPVNNLTGAGVETVPAGLNVEVFYGDATALPTEIGSVPVRAVINEPNYVGQTTGTFEVARAEQSITTFPFPTFTLSGAPINVGLFATASSGLPVTFSVVSGNGTVSGNTLTVSQPGDVIVLASQAGDDFWAPGSSTFTITATGQGVPTQAPQVSFGGVSDGGLVINVTGAPSATVKILSTAVIGSPLSEVATVTLDASGNGSVTIPTDQAAGYFTASN